MGAFDHAFKETLGFEGVYSDVTEDRGGRTKYGITEATFRDALKRGIVVGVSDVADLTVPQAKAIYRADYWDRLQLFRLEDQRIAAEIFDTAVNMGRSAAALICQRALNYLGEKLEEDGIMGRKTIAALNKWSTKDSRALFVCLNGFQFMRYVKIVSGNDTQKKFARGWTKRVQSYQT